MSATKKYEIFYATAVPDTTKKVEIFYATVVSHTTVAWNISTFFAVSGVAVA